MGLSDEIKTPIGWQVFGAVIGAVIATVLMWIVFPDAGLIARMFLIGIPIGTCVAIANLIYVRRTASRKR
jgi:hypothetical protein